MSLHDAVNKISRSLDLVREINDEICNESRSAHYGGFFDRQVEITCPLFEKDAKELVEILNSVTKKVRRYGCRVHDDDETKFFEAVHNEGLELKKLTVFLWYLIEKGIQSEKNKDDIYVSVAASDLYICFCGLKQAKLFQVFHSSIFGKAIEVLRTTEKIIRPLVSKVATIINKKRRDDQNNDPFELGPNLANEIGDQIKSTLMSLFLFVHSNSVADIIFEKDGASVQFVDFLRDIGDLDMGSAADYQIKGLDQTEEMNKACTLSAAIAHAILNKDSEKRSALIMGHFVMPRLLYWIGGLAKPLNGAIPNVLKDACQQMNGFLGERFNNITLTVLKAIMKMLKALPMKCIDRSEYRSQLAYNFAHILTMIPPIAAHHLIDFVYVLGRSNKTFHRSFALEVVPHILTRFTFENLNARSEPIESMFMNDADGDAMEVVEDGEEEIVEGDATAGDDEPMEMDEDEVENNEDGSEENENEPEEENGDRTDNSAALCLFERHNLTARQAVLNILSNGLIDKFAMQKALQAVDTLTSSQNCLNDLALLAKRMVEENHEALKITHRPVPEPRDRRSSPPSPNPVKDEPVEDEVTEEPTFSNFMNATNMEMPDLDDLLRLVMKACDNEKTAVAKYALICLQSILVHAHVNDEMARKSIEKIREKCWDVAIQVRKQAALCMHNLLQSERYPEMEHAWLRGLLHQVVDNEQGVATQAIKLASDHITKGLKRGMNDPTWHLMNVVEGDTEYTRYLSICLTDQPPGSSRTTNVGDDFVKCLEQATEQPNCPPSAWMLLAELSPYMEVKPQCAERAFDRISFEDSDDRIPTYVAKIIANRCHKISAERKNLLKEKIRDRISNNRVAVPHIAAVCYAFASLMNAVGKDDRPGSKDMKTFVLEYQQRAVMALTKDLCEPYQDRIKSRNSAANTQLESLASKTDTVLRMIHSIGELLQYAPGAINQLFIRILMLIVANEDVAVDHGFSQQFRPESVLTETQTQNPISNTQISQFKKMLCIIPPGIRAAAVFALGRIAILDEKHAKNLVPKMIENLATDPDHFVRNNILVILGDICTTGGALVNAYGPVLATAMRDKSDLVRRHAVSLITALIRDEFFKWGGQIMYFYFGALIDPNDRVREQVHASLLNVLLPKFPNMFSNKFVETLFYMNEVIHPSMQVLLKQEQENCALPPEDYFRISGLKNHEDRMRIYKFMISTFEDKNKVPLMGKISMEVFSCVVDETLDVKDPHVVSLMTDALRILRSDEIVLSMQAGKKTNADDVDEESEEANAMQALATDFISNVYMYKLNQDVLHHLFRARDYLKINGHTSLAKMCHSSILDLFKTYLEHFENLIGPDTQRRAEIANDLRRYRGIDVDNLGHNRRNNQSAHHA